MSRIKPITARGNPLWQRLRRLAQQPMAYRTQHEIWVDGEHLCAEVAQRGETVPMAVIGEAAWAEPALRRLAERAETVVLLSPALMASLSSLQSPSPLAFVMPWKPAPWIEPGMASVVLDRLQDPGNVGSILRSSAAFGVGQVIALAGSAALWAPKVLRAGMGAHWALRLIEGAAEADLDRLTMPLLATSPHAEASIAAVCLPWPCAWLMGHEGQGLGPSLLARCARTLRIPQPGGMESLNVASAAAVCLYESARQR